MENAGNGLVNRTSWGQGLEEMRGALDAVDGTILDAVRDRMAICARIGEYKRVHDIPMMQPDRVGVVQQRARSYALEHAISPEFLGQLYTLLVAEACRVEDVIIGAESASADSVDELLGVSPSQD